MNYWKNHIPTFRELIWQKCCFNDNGNQIVNIKKDNFRTYGFIDCLGHETSTPGAGPIGNTNERRQNAFEHQRAFLRANVFCCQMA